MRKYPWILSKNNWLEYIKKNSYNGRFLVNHTYRPQLKDHAVLRKLIKSRVLKVVRSGSRTCKRTYLVLDEYPVQKGEK